MNLPFIGTFSVCFITVVSLLLASWYRTSVAFGVFQRPNGKRRMLAILSFYAFLLSAVQLSTWSAEVLLSKEAKHELTEEPTSGEVSNIEANVDSLCERLETPDELSLNELRDAARQAVFVADEVKNFLSRQREETVRLKAVVQKEAAAAEIATKRADALRSLTQDQIEAFGSIVSHDAEYSAQKWFGISVIVTFIMGIMTSLIANYLFRNLTTRVGTRSK